MANYIKITFSDGKIYTLSENIISELSKGQVGINRTITVSGSVHSGGSGVISTRTGVAAGEYTIKDLLQALVNKSHSHSVAGFD